MTELEYREKMLEAAKLRSRAAHQKDQANSYKRAMETARDEKQRSNQQCQADKVAAMAEENLAKAALIEAKAKVEFQDSEAL